MRNRRLGNRIEQRVEQRQDQRQEQREVRREERQVFRRGGTATRYQMRQRLFAFGQDFTILNEQGQPAYRVDGKLLRVRDTLYFKDLQGRVLCRIQERLLRIRDTMYIESPSGQTIAVVRQALISPLRNRWTVKIGNGPDLSVRGNIIDMEYEISDGTRKVAEVSKRWFRVRDTYGVQIAPGQDDHTILAITVAIDMMAHPGT